MNIRTFKTILFVFLIVNFCEAQLSQNWLQRYNGIGNLDEETSAMTIDEMNNVYVAGGSTGTSTNLDITTIKYNSSGNQLWLQTYNGSQNDTDVAHAVKVDASGSVYVTGYSTGNGSGRDIVIIKYNSNGVQQWVQTYNGAQNGKDVATSIDVDNSGNVYVAGYSFGGATNYDGLLLKCNSSGVIQWEKRINGSSNDYDELVSVATDVSQNVYVTGAATETGTGLNCITIKYNSNGDQIWAKSYNSPDNLSDHGKYLVVGTNGDVYVAGSTNRINTYSDYLLIKYNSDGVEKWTDSFNGELNGVDAATSILLDNSGNVIVTGMNIEANWTFFGCTTLKYNPSGVRQWSKRYTEESRVLISSIATDDLGNIYLAGASHTLGTLYDYVTVKYNPDGIELWVEKYDGPVHGDDNIAAVQVDNFGNVYVTGESAGSSSQGDIVTIQYSQLTGVQISGLQIPKEFKLEQNFPNPFNPTTRIRYSIAENKSLSIEVKLSVYNELGKLVSTLVNENKSPGIYEVEFSGAGLSSGIYFYNLNLDGRNVETKSMVILK